MIGLLAALALYSGQEVQTFNDPFDPYSAVTVSLPDSAVKQQGEPATDPFAYIMTAKVRSTGEIQQYLKLELEYVTVPGLADTVGVDTAHYEGGQEADFEVIESTRECLPTRQMCKHREVLSVRFPFRSATGPIRVQFRNRGATWRGTVTIPSTLFGTNIARLAAMDKAN